VAIINLTPDSFADGGKYPTTAAAVDAARRAVTVGADMLDLGGESTRPGASPVSPALQADRILPVLCAIRAAPDPLGSIPISIDTTSSLVAESMLLAGADAINDISAGLDDPAMLPLIAQHGAGIILMHRLAIPSLDRYSDAYETPPTYDDVITVVRDFLSARANAALAAGIPREAIVLDPGLGFGKSVQQNLDLIARTRELTRLGFPILSALSRKSFVGRASLARDSAPAERLIGSIALSVAHALAGAALFRIHDVAEHAQAMMATAPILAPRPLLPAAEASPPTLPPNRLSTGPLPA